MLDHFEQRQDIILFIDTFGCRKIFNGLFEIVQSARLLK